MTKDKALYHWFCNAVHNWEIPVAGGVASDPVRTDTLLPAYPSAAVPDDALLPYLTYDAPYASFDDGPVVITVYLWFRATSEAIPNAAARELSAAVGYAGKSLRCDGGYIRLRRGSPFVKSVPEPERYVKGRYINIIAEYFTAN